VVVIYRLGPPASQRHRCQLDKDSALHYPGGCPFWPGQLPCCNMVLERSDSGKVTNERGYTTQGGSLDGALNANYERRNMRMEKANWITLHNLERRTYSMQGNTTFLRATLDMISVLIWWLDWACNPPIFVWHYIVGPPDLEYRLPLSDEEYHLLPLHPP